MIANSNHQETVHTHHNSNKRDLYVLLSPTSTLVRHILAVAAKTALLTLQDAGMLIIEHLCCVGGRLADCSVGLSSPCMAHVYEHSQRGVPTS